MDGLNAMTTTLTALQNYYDICSNIIIAATKDPEVLLQEQFLPYTQDRQYIFKNMIAYLGEESFNLFISEYFNQIIKVLSWKIPINDVSLQIGFHNDNFVLIGYLEDTPKLIINTFAKTIEILENDTRMNLINEQEECLQLIEELEQQLNTLSQNNGLTITKSQKSKHKANITMLIAQIGIEKENLSRIKESILAYDQSNAYIEEIAERYANRLISYYQFSLLKNVDSEQHTPLSEQTDQQSQ